MPVLDLARDDDIGVDVLARPPPASVEKRCCSRDPSCGGRGRIIHYRRESSHCVVGVLTCKISDLGDNLWTPTGIARLTWPPASARLPAFSCHRVIIVCFRAPYKARLEATSTPASSHQMVVDGLKGRGVPRRLVPLLLRQLRLELRLGP